MDNAWHTLANSQEDMFAEVRRLLRHLYDPIALRLSPLAQYFGQEVVNGHGNEAKLLRQLLMEAIETLSPGGNVPLRSEEWRPYRVVRERYVEQKPMDQLASEMGLSERQLRRELRVGTLAIVKVLSSRLDMAQPETPPEPPGDEVAEAIRDLGTAVEGVNVCAQLRAAESLVASLARDHQAMLIDHDLPESIIVQANRVLLRQVLLTLYTWSIEVLGAKTVETSVEGCDTTATVVLRSSTDQVEVLSSVRDEIVPAELLRALEGQLDYAQAGNQHLLTLRLPCTPVHRLLLVDDNPSLHNLVKRYLVGLPYALIGANDAITGLELARSQLPDAILVDIMMPGRDGWELLRMLKGDPATHHIPVVICSVLEQQALAESLNAAGYLTKPVTQSALLNLLDKLNLGRPA